MSIDRYRRQVTALVIEAARDDPELILEVIAQLKKRGEVSDDDLQHIERIALKWVRINRDNLAKGQCSQR
jgi:hypothetical protein